MCVFFRIFVCAKKKEKAPICTVQRYEEFWTCASNRPDKINCERKMSLMAHLIGRVRGACRQRRVFNPSCPHHKSDGSLSLLREVYVGRTQLPLPQDPVYGMAGTPYRPDTEDARYGQEITAWLRSHAEIKAVTRDGSQNYAAIISAASELIMQISDRFHLMQALKKDAVEPIKALLGQKKERMPYPYPSEDEAYRYILSDICRMGDARHREKVTIYYEVARLKDEGKSIAETARLLGIKSQKVRKALDTSLSGLLSERQKQAVKVARDMARIISSGLITTTAVARRLAGKVTSDTVNKAKAIKRTMFNRAKPEELRAKMLYSGLKWEWNYHPNKR